LATFLARGGGGDDGGSGNTHVYVYCIFGSNGV